MTRPATIYLESIDSTNNYAKEHRHLFVKDQVTCVVAEEQTKGRGRFERRWVSPPRVNLYATFYLQLPSQQPDLVTISQVMGTSIASVLMKEKLHPMIKWPNDVQLSGKKVAGILCETIFDQKEMVDLFVGIGININMEPQELNEIDQPATSLKAETKRLWDKSAILEKLQGQFLKDLVLFRKEGFAPFYPLFDSLLAYKGQTIVCFDGKKNHEGICHSITKEGHLHLLLNNNTFHTIFAGDVKKARVKH